MIAGRTDVAGLRNAGGGVAEGLSPARDGMVSRTVHPTVPPQAGYEVTALGHSLSEPILALGAWAQRHLPQIERRRPRYDQNAAAPIR